jgi:hypothetical protein
MPKKNNYLIPNRSSNTNSNNSNNTNNNNNNSNTNSTISTNDTLYKNYNINRDYYHLNIIDDEDEENDNDNDDDLKPQKGTNNNDKTSDEDDDDDNGDDDDDDDEDFKDNLKKYLKNDSQNEVASNNLYKINNHVLINGLYSYYKQQQQQHTGSTLNNNTQEIPISNSATSNSSYKSSSSSSSSYIPTAKSLNNTQKTYISCLKRSKISLETSYDDLQISTNTLPTDFQNLNETFASSIDETPAECICNNNNNNTDQVNNVINSFVSNLDDTVSSNDTPTTLIPLPSTTNFTSITTSSEMTVAENKTTIVKQILTSSFNISSSQSGNGTNHSLFKDTTNSSKILDGLNKLRESNCLCDVILKVDGDEFSCHKVCLITTSLIFCNFLLLLLVCIGIIKQLFSCNV